MKGKNDKQGMNAEDRDLWLSLKRSLRDGEPHGIEDFNALAALLDGHVDDPGHERAERLLARSEQALDDLVSVREVLDGPLDQPPSELIRRVSDLVRPRTGQGRYMGLAMPSGWVRLGEWLAGAALCLVLAIGGFRLGQDLGQLHYQQEALVLSELPLAFVPAEDVIELSVQGVQP